MGFSRSLSWIRHSSTMRSKRTIAKGTGVGWPIRLSEAGLDAGFIVNSPGPRTIRLAPPLVLTTAQADSFLAAFPAILQAAKDAQ